MYIKFNRDCVAAGSRYKVGESADVPDKDARLLINWGKAEQSAPKKKAVRKKAVRNDVSS